MSLPGKFFASYQHPMALWGVAMVLMTLLLISVNYFAYQREYAKAERSALEVAQTYHLLTVGVIEDLDRLVERAGKQYLHYPHEQNSWLTEQVLRERRFTNPHIMDLLVTDASGRIEVWTGSGTPPDITHRSYIRYHLDNPRSGLFVSEPMQSLVRDGQWFVALSRAVRAGDGRLMGVGVAIVAIGELRDSYARLLGNPDLAVLVVHQSGKLVLRVPEAGTPIGTDVSAYLGVELPVNAPVLIDVPASLDGKHRIVSLRPLAGTSLFVGGASSIDEALAVARMASLITLLVWLILAVVSFVQARKLGQSFERERRTQALYESLFTGVSDAIFVLGVESRGSRFRYLAVNPACEQQSGLSAREMVRRTPWDLLPAEVAERLIGKCLDCVKNGAPITLEEQLKAPDGLHTWMTTLNPASSASGEINLIVGVSRDITQRREAEERIAYLAHYDQLTGLPNRVLFSQLAERALHLARRQQSRLALLYIDLDKFKPVNDQHGHAVGDLLLQEVAQRMSGCLREADLLARIGGDEFVVLLQGIHSRDDALEPGAKILAELRRPFVIGELQLHISCSIGVALYPECGDDMIELTRHADEAMYAGKNAGRDRVMMFEAQMSGDGAAAKDG